MIMTVFILISAIVCKYEKSKIDYCDKMIYLGTQIKILLNTVVPETDEIFLRLAKCEKLNGIDFLNIKTSSPLKADENDVICEYIGSIGKYDVKTQIKKADEFCETFRLLKEDYRQYYQKHYKIIYALGFCGGAAFAIFLI